MLAFYSPDQSRVCTEQRCRYQDDFVGFAEFAQENGATSPRLAGRHVCVVTAYGVALASVLRWKHVAVIGFAYRRASEIEEQILRRFPAPSDGAFAFMPPPGWPPGGPTPPNAATASVCLVKWCSVKWCSVKW